LKSKRPRAARYPFMASVVLVDLESSRTSVERTSDVSLFGCHVVPGIVSQVGTQIRLQITHRGEVFEALGRVANVRPITGFGVVFTKVEGRYQLVLEKWLSELRKKN
jgi:hypothetical protein